MKPIVHQSFKHVIHNGLSIFDVQELLYEFDTPSGFTFVECKIYPKKHLFSVVFVFKSNQKASL